MHFMKRHAQSRAPLAAWLKEAEHANWRTWADVSGRFPSADLIGRDGAGHQVILNIKGNTYRLAALVFFGHGRIHVRKIGTHAQYSKWKPEDF